MEERNMNTDLEMFMREIGLLAPVSLDIEDDDDYVDLRKECLEKGYFRNPYDENGEVMF